MLNKKRRYRTNSLGNHKKLVNLKDNYLLILLSITIIVILYSIIDYNFFNKNLELDLQEYNINQIRKFNLKELYNNKNLNHNEVRIWILNNTNQRGLAGKIRDCFEKGYSMQNKKIKGDYSIFKQGNFKSQNQFNLGRIDENETKIFIHVNIEENPDFKAHIQEFLTFTGYSNNILEYEYNWKLYEQRDITIVLGNDWDKQSNLVYCKEPIN